MSLNWTGAWNANVTYEQDDVCYYNGSSFVALLGSNNVPPVDPNVGPTRTWDLLALQGSQGTIGAEGIQGPPGAPGAQGEQGVQGVPGVTYTVTGPQGIPGAQGPAGAQGEPGVQGVQGEPGPAGASGAQGAQGIQGARGYTGETGAQGEQGESGTSFIWVGNWTSSHYYVPGNCVGYSSGAYTCLNSVASSIPPDVDTANWLLMLQSEFTQVNADWNATSGAAEILNKPTLGSAASQSTSAFDAAGTAASLVATETSRATAAEALLVPKTTTINGQELNGNVTITYDEITGTPTLGAAASLNVGTTTGTVAAGNDPRFIQAVALAIVFGG